jgi:hypothetical protein
MQRDRLQEGEGLYCVWIYIASNVVPEGAVWPLQPVYGTLRSNSLGCKRGQATAYGYTIVSDVVQEGVVWRLHPVYDISDGAMSCRTAAHCRTAGQLHTATRTAGQPHTAARTATHCCGHCHTLPRALPSIHCCVHCRILPHTAALTDSRTLPRALPDSCTPSHALPYTATHTAAQCCVHC